MPLDGGIARLSDTTLSTSICLNVIGIKADGTWLIGLSYSKHHAAGGTKPPLPPFNTETTKIKVQVVEDAWNTRDLYKVSLAYTEDSQWRNRSEFLNGREQFREFLTRKWQKELKPIFC